MRKLFGFAAVVVLLVGASLTARAETYSAYLTGAQEVPAVATTATGRATVVIDQAAGTVTFTVVFNGLTSAQTLSHIHSPAVVGATAAVSINFGVVGGTSGTITGTTAITPTIIAQIRSGQAYVNVHSTNNPNGEIRGQLAKLRPVDYDGDGRMDLSVLRFPTAAPPAVAQITYYNQLSSGGSFAADFGDANTDFPAPGDYDGDGKGDLALYRSTTTAGADQFFLILQSSNNTFRAIKWGVSGDQVIARDFDGDGITNPAVYRRGVNVGDQCVFYYRTTTGAQVSIPFGKTGDTAGSTSGDTPVPADYDGDGKVDVAIYRFGFGGGDDNSYYILQSSNGAVKYQQWGSFDTDYVVPGDYDGDGKCDFMAARTGATTAAPVQWYLLRSSDGGMIEKTFGRSDDLPVQGDYDGDGKADIAMYRRGATASANSTFFVQRSFDGVATGTFWGLRADFPPATFDAR